MHFCEIACVSVDEISRGTSRDSFVDVGHGKKKGAGFIVIDFWLKVLYIKIKIYLPVIKFFLRRLLEVRGRESSMNHVVLDGHSKIENGIAFVA